MDAGPDGGSVAAVPLDPDSPWPKFRANPAQDGRADVAPIDDGSQPWVFATGKGIFSTPVVDGDGNVYVGSADRVFYSIAPDGTERWSRRTGEIIDSSALLDDRGRVYFGSGDGLVDALDRETGEEIWRFQADDPSEQGAFIRWFEGNVAMGTDGTLFVPNDNFCTYAIDRDSGEKRWCFRTLDQTWSLPAVDATTGRLFIGNNYLLGDNVFAIDATTGEQLWEAAVVGATMAASPMLVGAGDDARAALGGFDGFVRALSAADGSEAWAFGARDHVYASPARLSDGTIVQPAADGTVYGLAPEDGRVRWSFDALEPIRSSPAVDAEDHIYVGSGEGKLFVLDPDGTLRWSLRLIDAERDDLNASVALGTRGIHIAGENGGVFFVPFDYCLRAEAADDARCRLGPTEELATDGISLRFTTRFGRPLAEPPESIDANQPLALSLFARESGDTTLALLDADSLTVDVDPPIEVRVDVSGDRHFVTIAPADEFSPDETGHVHVRVRGDILVGFARSGLRFDGGEPGGSFDQTFDLAVRPAPGGALPFPIPATPGEPAGVLELSRFAAPLPTILPSYNQIGFDSIHYIVGIVEGTEDRAVAWGIGAAPSGPNGEVEVDPASAVRFPLVVRFHEGLVTLANEQRFDIEFNGFRLPFESFRVATRLDADGNALESPAVVARAVCGEIDTYGLFLRALGFCNPVTDALVAFGAAEMAPHAGGSHEAPAGVGSVTFERDGGAIVATLSGSSLPAAEHALGILLIDTATGMPINADYVAGTSVEADGGQVRNVRLDATGVHGEVRATLMVDAYPAARGTLALP